MISHYVRADQESNYEEWLQGISQVAKQFEGHRGVTVLRPQPSVRTEYVIILRFEKYQYLYQWMLSPERQEWISKAEEHFVEKPENVQVLTGLEAFVSLPNTMLSPPPKHKIAFVTWIGVYACVAIIGYFLMPYLEALPYLLRQAIMTGLVVVLLAYVVMPQLTRLFHGWLHG